MRKHSKKVSHSFPIAPRIAAKPSKIRSARTSVGRVYLSSVKKTIRPLFYRPEAMVGSSCRPLVALGYRGILVGGCGDAAVAAHDRETDLCHGERVLSSTCPRLHGRHPVGASRDPAERCVSVVLLSRTSGRAHQSSSKRWREMTSVKPFFGLLRFD